MSFLDFVKHKEMMNENVQWMNEAFKASQFGKAKGLLLTLFKKEITKGFVGYLGIYDLKVDGNDCQSSVYYVMDKSHTNVAAFAINFLQSGESMVPYSVAIFGKDNADKFLWSRDSNASFKANLEIKMMGASIVYYMVAFRDEGSPDELGERIGHIAIEHLYCLVVTRPDQSPGDSKVLDAVSFQILSLNLPS